jgi:hypothetical protein
MHADAPISLGFLLQRLPERWSGSYSRCEYDFGKVNHSFGDSATVKLDRIFFAVR